MTSPAVEVQLNGEQRSLPAGLTVRTLLDSLGIREDLVAVEIDREIVRRRDFPTRAIAAGESIEIVEFVGGG